MHCGISGSHGGERGIWFLQSGCAVYCGRSLATFEMCDCGCDYGRSRLSVTRRETSTRTHGETYSLRSAHICMGRCDGIVEVQGVPLNLAPAMTTYRISREQLTARRVLYDGFRVARDNLCKIWLEIKKTQWCAAIKWTYCVCEVHISGVLFHAQF